MKKTLLGIMFFCTTMANADTLTLVRSCAISPELVTDQAYTVDIVKTSSPDGMFTDFKAFVYVTNGSGRHGFATYDLEAPKPSTAGIIRYVGTGFKFQINSGVTIAPDPLKSAELIAINAAGDQISLSSDHASGTSPATVSCE